MDQNERLDYLVKQFRKDSLQYRNLEVPPDQVSFDENAEYHVPKAGKKPD